MFGGLLKVRAAGHVHRRVEILLELRKRVE